MRVSLRSAEGHQRDLLDPTRLQPLRGHERTLAASATKDNALGGQRFRGDFRDVIDIETARPRERRPRRFLEAAQIDDQIIGHDRLAAMNGRDAAGSGAPAKPKPPKASLRASKVTTLPSAAGSRPSSRCSARCACRPPSTATAVPSTPTVAQVPPSTETSGNTAR